MLLKPFKVSWVMISALKRHQQALSGQRTRDTMKVAKPHPQHPQNRRPFNLEQTWVDASFPQDAGISMCVYMLSHFSGVQLFATPWTVAHPCILAWKIPWTEEPSRPQSMGLQRVKHDWVTKHIILLEDKGERKTQRGRLKNSFPPKNKKLKNILTSNLGNMWALPNLEEESL